MIDDYYGVSKILVRPFYRECSIEIYGRLQSFKVIIAFQSVLKQTLLALKNRTGGSRAIQYGRMVIILVYGLIETMEHNMVIVFQQEI